MSEVLGIAPFRLHFLLVFLFIFVILLLFAVFFFQAEDGIRDYKVTGVQTCALPISGRGLTDREKLESARWVERVSKAYASMFTSFVVHCNRVGYEDGLHFWGGATVNDPNGELIAHGPYFEEALTVVQLDLNQLRRTRARLPLLRDERTNMTVSELQRILQK